MDALRIRSNVAPEDVERFKKQWEALINTRSNRTVPIIAIPTLQWQQEFPTQDGFYWFYGGNWDRSPDREYFDLPPQPPTIAYVVDSRRFCYTAQGIWYDKSAFPGYCAGPLLSPPVPEHKKASRDYP
mgnify:FL=1